MLHSECYLFGKWPGAVLRIGDGWCRCCCTICRCVHTQSLLEFQENCFASPDYFKFSTKLQLLATQKKHMTLFHHIETIRYNTRSTSLIERSVFAGVLRYTQKSIVFCHHFFTASQEYSLRAISSIIFTLFRYVRFRWRENAQTQHHIEKYGVCIGWFAVHFVP